MPSRGKTNPTLLLTVPVCDIPNTFLHLTIKDR